MVATHKDEIGTRVAGGAALAVLFACALCCVLGFGLAFANQTMDAPTTVSDDITRLHVDKLDADTHEYVQGAKMSIIEKDTNTVVDEWTTGSTTHENEKSLDVGKTYILREVTAPDGYEKAKDTEFVVNETEGMGITILSGDDAELTESYKLNLYDKAKDVERETVVKKERETAVEDDKPETQAPEQTTTEETTKRETTDETTTDETTDETTEETSTGQTTTESASKASSKADTAPTTGDTALLQMLAGLAALSAIIALIALLRSRRRRA